MNKDKIKKFYNEILNFGRLCTENHLDSHSAAAAFFIFVSLIPFIIMILSVIPYTPITDEYLLKAVSYFLPKELEHLASDLLIQFKSSSVTILSVSAITAVWTASRSVLTIKRGLDNIHGIKEEGNFIVLRFSSILQMIILMVSILGILVMNVVLTGIDKYFREVLGIVISEKYSFINIIMIFKPVITFVIAFSVILYVFVVIPKIKIKIKQQIPGAIFTCISWYVFSWIFSIYVNNFHAYNMYGSLTAIIINLIWLYACMYFMFLGAEFNYYLSLRRENRKI